LDSSDNFVVSRSVLNNEFSNLKVFVVDKGGNGDGEIDLGGVKNGSLLRGLNIKYGNQTLRVKCILEGFVDGCLGSI